MNFSAALTCRENILAVQDSRVQCNAMIVSVPEEQSLATL